MAEREQGRGAESESSQFCCSVCLDQLKDPVTIPCGHSYCKSCIEGFWDQNEEKGLYSCPQCRETFSPRPVLRRNNMLAEVVGMLKRTSTQQTSSSPAEVAATGSEACASPSEVMCDFCCGDNPNKATKSCLTCIVSYCPAHLEPHYSIPALKRHQLVPATVPLQEKMCSKHNKLMEVYCSTDQKCICYLCVIDEHKNHETVSTAAEREEQQKQLTVSQQTVKRKEKERGRELAELLEAQKDFKKCSRTAVEACDRICDELILTFQKNVTLVRQKIVAQEQAAVAQAEGLQLQLEEEIAKLRKRDAELEQVSQIDDNIYFIQTFQSLSASCESPDLPNGCIVRSKHSFRTVTDFMSNMKENIEEFLEEIWPDINAKVSSVNVLLQPEPKTREEFLRYCCPLKLDENAVSKNLVLSQAHLRAGSKTHKYSSQSSWTGYVTKRVTGTEQVWCSEALKTQCYWEVDLCGYTWCVAVSYKDKSGTSSYQSEFGMDDRSWSLECSSRGCSLRHNNQSVNVSGSKLSRIGVYLDFLEGFLSFYEVSGLAMTLLQKVDTTFTEPVYPCFGFKDDGSQKSTTYYAELVQNW